MILMELLHLNYLSAITSYIKIEKVIIEMIQTRINEIRRVCAYLLVGNGIPNMVSIGKTSPKNNSNNMNKKIMYFQPLNEYLS